MSGWPWPPRWRSPVRRPGCGARASGAIPASDSYRLPLAAVPEPPTPPVGLPGAEPSAPGPRLVDEARGRRGPRARRPSTSRSSSRPKTGAVERLDERRRRLRVQVQVPGVASCPTYPVVVNAAGRGADRPLRRASDRERFGMWISRSGRYLPMIQRIFRERGLPGEARVHGHDRVGFSPRAVSRVGAKGMWQFMEATGAALRPRHRPVDR